MLHVKFRDLSICLRLINQRGSHHLEFSLVLPILFFLVLGAFDINSALQSYTALQEGVKKSLRCVYATDGECVQGNPGTVQSFSEVIGVPGLPSYIVDRYDYTAEAISLKFPEYSIEPVVEILDYATYNMTQYKQSGSIPYLIQTHTLPYVSGDGLNPNFGTPPSAGNSAANDEYPRDSNNNSINNYLSRKPVFTSTTTERERERLKDIPEAERTFINVPEDAFTTQTPTFKTIDDKDTSDSWHNKENKPYEFGERIGDSGWFTIPSPFQDGIECFQSNQLDSNAPNPSANYSSSCDKNNANILIHIKGTTLRSSRDDRKAEGKVIIVLKEQGGKIRHLGGRKIDSGPGSNGDFTTRGLLKSSGSFINATTDFVEQYDGEANLHSNISVPYNTKFKIEFYLNTSNNVEIGWKPDLIRIFTSIFKNSSADVECSDWINDRSDSRTTCPASHPAGTTARVKGIIDAKTKVREERHYCPDNKGSKNPDQDCELLCRPPAEAYTELKCHERVKNLEEFRYIIPDCNSTNITENNYSEKLPGTISRKISDYADLKSLSVKLTGKYKVHLTKDQDPRELKKDNKYSCDEIKTETIFLDDPVSNPKADTIYPNLRYDSLFRDKRYTLGDNWQEILKQHARNLPDGNAIDPDMFIEVEKHDAGTETFTTEPPYPYKIEMKDPRPGEAVNLGMYNGKTLPAPCLNGTYTCHVEFKGYTDGVHAHVGFNETRALEIGRSEILSSFPRANFSEDAECSLPYCTSFSGGVNDVTNTATYSASMAVPMLFLGNQPLTISYSDNHRLEKRYSK